MDCARRAWLELDDGRTVALEDPAAGYFCSSLDLGFPDVREVIQPIPDGHGVIDSTQYLGGRVVTAAISAVAGAGARIDEVAASFAPFLLPGRRPDLHYILDRPGQPERVLTVRGANYTWPIAGPSSRDIQLQFLAADPIARDPTLQTVVAYSGASTGIGRRYPLVFPRVYPAGAAVAQTGRIEHAGDVAARPRLRIYGPITAPRVTFTTYTPPTVQAEAFQVGFAATFRVDPGHYVEIDTAAYTASLDGDPARPVEHFLVWAALRWPVLAAAPSYSIMRLDGTTTSPVTQCQAAWQDGFLV